MKMQLTKRLFSLLLAFLMVVSVLPVTAYASISGDGWYIIEEARPVLCVTGKLTSLPAYGYYSISVVSSGELALSDSEIWSYPVMNDGTISGGTFQDVVENRGTISGGTFRSTVENWGTISGGNGGCVVKLYAQWKPVEYTVTYMADGQTVSTETVEYGKDATLPDVPAKDGFVGKWDGDGKNIAGDTTISAVYLELPVVKSDEVKIEDKTDLADIKTKLEEELQDDAYTEDNKEKIQGVIDNINDALAVIANVENVEDLIDKLPNTVTKDDESAIKAADDAYNALTDYEKSLVDEVAKNALDDAKAALAKLKKPADDKPENDPESSQPDDDKPAADSDSHRTGDNGYLLLWVALLFISGTGIITIALAERKRRTMNKF